MATSGTYTFTLDITDIIEDAYERIGIEARSGYDYRTARRSLDMLLLEWQNRGLNLWTIQQADQVLTAGVAQYTLSSEKLDIIEAVARSSSGVNQNDFTLERISVSQYAHYVNKNTRGRPTQFWVDRQPQAVTLNLWPVPEDSTYTLHYWYMTQIEDTGKPGSNTIDVPTRFIPALVAGLAYNLALKTPKSFQSAPILKEVYEEQWTLASDSAREKASLWLKPSTAYSL
tara:strand:- start:1505 stop:2191 length:687 start_codon:yes stop_codon:yes gene_type:complete